MTPRQLLLVDSDGEVTAKSFGESQQANDRAFRVMHLDANLALGMANCGRKRLRPEEAPHLTLLVKLAHITKTSLMWEMAVEELSAPNPHVVNQGRRTDLERIVSAGLREIISYLDIPGRHRRATGKTANGSQRASSPDTGALATVALA